MSQCVTECTACSENGHTRLHPMNLCSYCRGDIRHCGCEPPSERPTKGVKNSAKNYKWEFNQLLQKYEQVSAAYRATKEQEARWPHEKRALTAELEALKEEKAEIAELEEDNQELVHLNEEKQRQIVFLREEVESLKETLLQRDREIEELRASRQPSNPDHKGRRGRVSRNDLTRIHKQYKAVLEVMAKGKCTIRNAFRLAGQARSTVRDLVGIAKLKIVDPDLYNVMLREAGRDATMKAIERACRGKIARAGLRAEMVILLGNERLLPFCFTDAFYE